MRVLLVEDSALVRRAIQRAMGVGFQVTAVPTAAEACSLLRDGSPWDTILCDLHLQDAPDGRLVLDIQQKYPRHAASLVILTGGAQTARAEELLAQTSLPVLFKPVGVSTLRSLVRRLSRGDRRANPRRTGVRLGAQIGPDHCTVVDYSRTGLRLRAPGKLHSHIRLQLTRGATSVRVEGHHVRDAEPQEPCYEMAALSAPDARVLEEWLQLDARV